MRDSNSKVPRALVTNDDGFNSPFMWVLVEALSEYYSVSVAAPAREQSWIGRAMSRHHRVSVKEDPDRPVPAWMIDGTPADCVNIALGRLLPQAPDIVVSGINVGLNTTIPFILSSGTVGGALEGSFRGLPAIAASLQVPDPLFERLNSDMSNLPAQIIKSLKVAATVTTQSVVRISENKNTHGVVYNLNFPASTTPETPIENTVPAPYELGNLFNPTDCAGEYTFAFRHGTVLSDAAHTDWACIRRNHISVSRLNFTNIGLD